MTSGVNMLCFTASYSIALALEAAGVWTRPRWRRLAVALAALAGIVAHTWYLGQRAATAPWAPLSSPHDWCLAAAWALAVIYLALVLYQPRTATGLFLLPVMLALVATSRGASREPIASFEAPRFWSIVHGVFLMLGTVAVLLGFVAGVMYLLQSRRLKQKLPATSYFRLPSLEWLEQVNSRSLAAAAVLVAVGFFTGVLARLATVDGEVPWTDPVVLSLSGMLTWLIAAEAFRLAYPAARRGRKVAYLTLAGFVFLVFTLATFMRNDGVHSARRESRPVDVENLHRAPGAARHRPRRVPMNLRMVGCTHRATGVDVRQQLAFGDAQVPAALESWRERFPAAELVLVSTCNRVELYAGGQGEGALPGSDDLVDALLSYHRIPFERVQGQVLTLAQRDAVAHLYRVAASLDSMVVGEPQILAQVKQAYQRAAEIGAAGPVMHDLFQSAIRAARRVHHETDVHRRRVSIPSVAIVDFASRVFERFDDKHILVVGAGKMADETLRYLQDAGARRIRVVNRNQGRAEQLAASCRGVAIPWAELWDQLVDADLVVSTTAAGEPVVTAAAFDEHVAPRRQQRPLFILDLAVPRDFDPAVGERLSVYLYSLDDLAAACERNRQSRARELPAAERIVLEETDAFMAAAHRRAAAPVITGLRRGMEEPKQLELERLFRKLPELDERSRAEITQFADRLVNKLLHPPLESLRDAAQHGPPHGLLDALKRLFRLED